MNADVNLFGPGNRANATIGRATRLILRNVFQMIPGISDKSTQGNPGKYSFCIAERARGNPWPLLCETQDYPAGRIQRHGVRRRRVLQRRKPRWQHTRTDPGVASPTRWPIMAASRWARASSSSRRSTCASSPTPAGPARTRKTSCFRTRNGPSTEMTRVGKYRDVEYDKQHGADAHPLAEAGYRPSRLDPR